MVSFDLANEKILDNLQKTLDRDNLSELYVNLDEVTPKNVNETFLVSYFDHILTEEEYANEKLVCYADVAKLDDVNFDEKFTEIANAFLCIYEDLFYLNDGFVYVDNNSSIIKTKNKNIYVRHVINGLKERPLCCLVFQNLKLVVNFGYDLTHQFYVLDGGQIKKIREIASSTRLFTL